MRQPHHGRNGSKHVGRLRIAAAKILSEGLGWEVFPEEIQPVTGSYRTCKYHDVYRWGLFTCKNRNKNLPYVAGCWESLTDFVKYSKRLGGFHIGTDYVIYPGPDKAKGT